MIKLIATAAISYVTVSGEAQEHMPMTDLISPEAIAAVLISLLMLPMLRRAID